jgi:hypothetical protein
MAVDAVFVFQKRGEIGGAEQAERTFENGTDLLARFEHIDRAFLHQLL